MRETVKVGINSANEEDVLDDTTSCLTQMITRSSNLNKGVILEPRVQSLSLAQSSSKKLLKHNS